MLKFKVGNEYQFNLYATDKPITFLCRSVIDDFATLSLKDDQLAVKYDKYDFELDNDHITYLFRYWQPNCWAVIV